MRLSAVICGRNDDYGGFLNERATYCFNTMLRTFDEVIYVDWNTDNDKPVLVDDLKIDDRTKLKVIELRKEKCIELIGEEEFSKAQKMCEVLSRNIGIRRATGDVIVSTNLDIIPPPRELLDFYLKDIQDDDMYTFTRMNISHKDLPHEYDILHTLLVRNFGIEPMMKKLMINTLRVTKEHLDNNPKEACHAISSLIQSCGDFQVAKKSMWYKIRGFEEKMTKRLFADTNVQYKVLCCGGKLTAMNAPGLFHLDHDRNDSPPVRNSEYFTRDTSNPDTWGFSTTKF